MAAVPRQENEMNSSNIIKFLKIVGKLKNVKRAGWVRHDIKLPESVSDHMYRMAVMSFLISSDTTVDKNRCMKLALVHDLAESIVGDITPFDNVTKEEKHHRERTAMADISKLVDGEIGQEISALWEEYESQVTSEAKLVKDFDIFEMLLQAHEYETDQGLPGHLEQFFTNTRGKIQTDLVKKWENELLAIHPTNANKDKQ